jgi:hypothetical protein
MVVRRIAVGGTGAALMPSHSQKAPTGGAHFFV